ncbi:hypothetical protein PhCBS80983_g00399 [Powellomyces hirtus]|uniref:Uncharacterized protein n=1 Tax=Powellomyces hirtus TaxID=109895 RepID=A0A507EFS1_9FUNG|nr:hypothetical protein PhCBS80983_g00399 [Powellomyces hirtus]
MSASDLPLSTTFPFAFPLSSQLTSDVAELSALIVLHLWSRISITQLLIVWSSSISAAASPMAAYYPSPASTVSSTSFTSSPSLSSSVPLTPAGVTQFRGYVEHLLSTTKVSSSVIVLALKYLQRISANRHLIRGTSPLVTLADSYKLAFTVSLVLANKFADDERFTNMAWASVADFDVDVLNRAELDALDAIQWKLTVDEGEYTKWIETVSLFASSTAAASEDLEQRKQLIKAQQQQQEREELLLQQQLGLQRARQPVIISHLPSPPSQSSPFQYTYHRPRSGPMQWQMRPRPDDLDANSVASLYHPSVVVGH